MGPLWTWQRGRPATSGITQVVLTVGDAAAPRLRQGGADSAQVQALFGHASRDTTARYFRASTAEQAAVVEPICD